MNYFLYHYLPTWIYGYISRLTGWQLVEYQPFFRKPYYTWNRVPPPDERSGWHLIAWQDIFNIHHERWKYFSQGTYFESLTDEQIGRLHWYFCDAPDLDGKNIPPPDDREDNPRAHDEAVERMLDAVGDIGRGRGIESFDAYCPDPAWL